MAEVVLVIPCFNEADRLPCELLSCFARTNPHVHFLLVNDGSQDRTLEILQGLSKALPASFELLDLQPNRGKAEAVRHGLNQAMDANPEFVGFWDADLSTPLGEVERFLERLRAHPSVDIVLGSRVKLLGRTIERKAYRHYLGRVFATAASLLLDLPVYDTQCGAKVFRVHDRNRRLFAEPFMSGWSFDVELLLRYLAQSSRPLGYGPASEIVELPLFEWIHAGGSKVTPMAFFAAGLQLFRMWRHYGRGGRKQMARVTPKRLEPEMKNPHSTSGP